MRTEKRGNYSTIFRDRKGKEEEKKKKKKKKKLKKGEARMGDGGGEER